MEETHPVVLVEVRAFNCTFFDFFSDLNFNLLGEALGQCCGNRPIGQDCGGYSGGKAAVEHYRDGLFEEPMVTTWTRKFIFMLKV